MIPKQLRIDVIKINSTQIGAMYLIIITYNFSRLNLEDCFISSVTTWGFRMYPTRTHMQKATIGINTLFARKSKNSKNDMFNGFICDQIPNPSVDGKATIILNSVTKIVPNKREVLNLSLTIETIVSIIEIEEVIAANKTSKKNNVPTSYPIGIWLNK